MKIDELFERLRPVGASREDFQSGSKYEALLSKIESKLDKAIQSSLDKDEDLYPIYEEQRQALESVSLSLKELLSKKDSESVQALKKSMSEESKVTKITRKVLEERPDEDKLKFTDSFEASMAIKSHSEEIKQLMDEIKEYKKVTKQNKKQALDLSKVFQDLTNDLKDDGNLGAAATALAPLSKKFIESESIGKEKESASLAKDALEKSESIDFLPKEITTSLRDIYDLIDKKLEQSKASEENSYLQRMNLIQVEAEESPRSESDNILTNKLQEVNEELDKSGFQSKVESTSNTGQVDSVERVNANSEEYLSQLQEDNSYKVDIASIKEDVSKILSLMGGDSSSSEDKNEEDLENETSSSGGGSLSGIASFGKISSFITKLGPLITTLGTVAAGILAGGGIAALFKDKVLDPVLEEGRKEEGAARDKLQTLKDLRSRDMQEMTESERKVYEEYIKKLQGEIYKKEDPNNPGKFIPVENPTEEDKFEYEESQVKDRHERKTTSRAEWLKKIDSTEDKLHARALNMARYGTENPTQEQIDSFNASYNMAQSLGISREEASNIYAYLKDPTDENFKKLSESERQNLSKAQFPEVGNVDSDRAKARKDAEYAFKAVGIGGQNTYDFSNKDYGRLEGELGEKYGGLLTVNGVSVDWGALSNSIAGTETGGRYDIQNSAGHNYFGKYQLGIQELQGLGFLDENDKSWSKMSKLDRTEWIKGDVWKGEKAKEFGISSLEDFYNSPESQEWAARAYTESNMRALSNLKINVGGKQVPLFEAAKGLNYTPEQVVKAAQFGGGNLQAVLQAEQEINEKHDVQNNMDFLAGKKRKEINGKLFSSIDGTGVSIKNYLNDASARNIALQREGGFEYSNRLNYQGSLTNEVNMLSLENRAKSDRVLGNNIASGSFVNGKWDDSGDYSKLESGDFISFKDNFTAPKMLGFVGVNKLPDGTYQSIMVDPKTKGPALPDKDGKFATDAVSVSIDSPMYSEIMRVNLAKQDFKELPENFVDSNVKDLEGNDTGLTVKQQMANFNTMVAAAKNSSNITYGAAMVKANGGSNIPNRINGSTIFAGKGDMMGVYNSEPEFDLSKLSFGETSNSLPVLEMEYSKQDWNIDTRSLKGGNVVKAEVLDDMRGRAHMNPDGTPGVVSEYQGEPELDIRTNLTRSISDGIGKATSKLSDWASHFRKRKVAGEIDPKLSVAIDKEKIREAEHNMETASMNKVQEVLSRKPDLPALKIPEKREPKEKKEIIKQTPQQTSSVVTTIINYQTVDSLSRDDIGNIGTA